MLRCVKFVDSTHTTESSSNNNNGSSDGMCHTFGTKTLVSVNMAAPRDLSIAEIRKFMIANGGKVTNHELVKYFKPFLTNPNTKGECSFVPFRRQ